jgi:DNA-binding transcriptional ArsR family regulator
MAITFNPVPGKLFDLIQVIKYGVNNDSYDRIVALSGIAPDPSVIEAAQYVWRESDTSTPGAVLFFTKRHCPECFMSNHYFKQLAAFPSVDALIGDFAAIDRRQLKTLVLSFLDRDNKGAAYYNRIIEDPAALYAFVEELDCPPVLKWELIALVNNPDPLIKTVCGLMTEVAERLGDVYRKNAKELENFKQRFETKIKLEPDALRNEFSVIERRFSVEIDENVVCSCSFMNETTLTMLKQPDILCVILGVNYQKVLGTHYIDNDPINLDATLKALSDTARLKILQMLAIGDMYVAEIAQAIDKGMSTTSYHLDMLHYAGLVTSRTEGKRTYYMLDRENFQKRLELLQHFVGTKG